MTATRWSSVVLACTLSAHALCQEKANKLPDAVAKAFEKATELEVYSLNGETSVKDGWHGGKVLGKTTVKRDAATKLGKEVIKGVAEGDKPARCFLPRHGVRVVRDGKTYDLLVCFECGWVYIYTDKSDKPTVLMISSLPHKLLDKILTDANVPLAKPEKP